MFFFFFFIILLSAEGIDENDQSYFLGVTFLLFCFLNNFTFFFQKEKLGLKKKIIDFEHSCKIGSCHSEV